MGDGFGECEIRSGAGGDEGKDAGAGWVVSWEASGVAGHGGDSREARGRESVGGRLGFSCSDVGIFPDYIPSLFQTPERTVGGKFNFPSHRKVNPFPFLSLPFREPNEA